MILEIIIFLTALAILAKSADSAIDQVVLIARHLNISDFTAGFILIAVSTSLPELLIGVFSSASKTTGIGVGNVLGANIANLLLILGLIIFLHKIEIRGKKLAENAQVMVFITFIPIAMLLSGQLGLVEGIALIALFVTYCVFAFKEKIALDITPKDHFKSFRTFFIFALSIALLLLSANILVSSTSKIAAGFGIPASLIAVTVVSLGTTLPELASSLSALKKKRFEIAIGTLVGSVITNSTLVLGAAAIVNPLSYNKEVILTAVFFLVLAQLLAFSTLTIQGKLNHKIGLTLLSAYALFILIEIGIISI